MSETAQPPTVLVPLSCGASLILYRLLQATGWNKTPKEKHAAGRIQLSLEELVFSQPDPPAQDSGTPGYTAAVHACNHATREWERKQAPALELSEYRFQTAQTCIKYFAARDDTGTNRFLSELQEAFRVIE